MKEKRTRFFSILLCVIILLCSGVTAISPLSPYTTTAKAHSRNIEFSRKSKKIAKGQTYKIRVNHTTKDDQVVFQIADDDIASISSETNKFCKIKGIRSGKTKLYATIYRNKEKIATLKCNITVTMPAVSVRFRTSGVTLNVSGKYNLLSILNLKPKYTAEIPVFSVSDKSILSVRKNGTVTAISEGTAFVTASIASGKSDTITITVTDKDS